MPIRCIRVGNFTLLSSQKADLELFSSIPTGLFADGLVVDIWRCLFCIPRGFLIPTGCAEFSLSPFAQLGEEDLFLLSYGRRLFVFAYKGKDFYRGGKRVRGASGCRGWYCSGGGWGVGGRFLRDGGCSQLPKGDDGFFGLYQKKEAIC